MNNLNHTGDFIPAIEKADIADIRNRQEVLLKEQMAYFATNSPFYQRMFAQNGIDPSQIRSLRDLEKLPVTTKDDLQRNNQDFLCVPPSLIIDYITTSGTLGDPVTLVLTSRDLDRLAYNEAISIACAGVGQEDIVQLMTTIDRRFMAGLAYFLGVRKLGAGIVRVGNGIPELQWDTIRRIKPTTLIVVPSFLVKMIGYAREKGIYPNESGVKKAICIGESIRNPDFSLNTLGTIIKSSWNLELFSTYASSEMGTAFTECEAGTGGHHHPELVIVEFLDEKDQPVNPGEVGEVTITTLGIEGMPLLRFKTGDICQKFEAPCSCGRNTFRLGPVIGRRMQMIKFKGTTLYPPALFDVLNAIDFVENYIVEVFTNSLGTDEVLVRLACKNAPLDFQQQIQDHFRAVLRVTPQIRVEEKAEIMKDLFPEISRKPIKFIDRR